MCCPRESATASRSSSRRLVCALLFSSIFHNMQQYHNTQTLLLCDDTDNEPGFFTQYFMWLWRGGCTYALVAIPAVCVVVVIVD